MERRAAGCAEIRESGPTGPTLYGTVIREGRPARSIREVFAPGSVQWPADGMGILTRHRSQPVARAIPTREPDGRITIATPATDPIREAIASGRREMSVEFFPLEERRTAAGVREIVRAFVPDVALVPAGEHYGTGAEIRRRTGTLTTFLVNGQSVGCRCAGQGAPDADTISVEVNGWDAMRLMNTGAIRDGVSLARYMKTVRGITDEALERIAKTDVSSYRNPSAIVRGAGDVVADVATGSLTLDYGKRGLGVKIDPLDTEAGRQVIELVRAGVSVYARPVIDFRLSAWERGEDGRTVKVNRGIFSYVLVKPTDNARGLDPLRAGGRISKRRRRLLLGAA